MGISATLRRPKEDDVPEIEDIAKKYNHPLEEKFIHAAVVEKHDDVVAFGLIRSNIEAIFYGDGSNRDKVESLLLLIPRAILDARSVGADDIYVFARDKEFADILIKKFGFRKAQGIPLILDI